MPNLKRRWRRIEEEEVRAIERKLYQFGVSLEDLAEKFELMIFEMARKEVMLVRKRQVGLILQLKPYTAGITFGEFKGKDFNLSLAGGSVISRYAKKRRVFLDEEGVLEFIYGKDVKSAYICKADSEISHGDLVLVVDEEEEYVGLGKAEVKNFRVVGVKNVIDIGWYLRSEIDENKAV